MRQPTPFKQKLTSIALAMIVAPQILASGLRGDVLLIHDHHGETAHAHLIERQNLDAFDPHDEHHQGEHYHDRKDAATVDCSENEHGCNIYEITLAGGFLTGRSRSEIGSTLQIAPLSTGAKTSPHRAHTLCDGSHNTGGKLPARTLRTTEAILRTSNALLI